MDKKHVQDLLWLKFNKRFATCLNPGDKSIGPYYWEAIRRGWSYEGLMGVPDYNELFSVHPWKTVYD
eukprot:5682896-Prorocentrum_lima.AAC.1